METTIYTHDCINAPKAHLKNNKHWAKLVENVDRTKPNGFAFEGKWLDHHRENCVPVGSIVVEVCGDYWQAYEMQLESAVRFASADRDQLPSFIHAVADRLFLKTLGY